ncbi:hypothetical protein CIHG_05995 [Coccidioides immitis H538.4]|uniref:Uncharacterized protein n=3 Tax=Coccidioides immitis TaxID=5501 RepID=A0A0J8QWI6_COCIT|nr:hypothetical protein CIRG_01744 [Coccidioides immitis RMSCC 2394]KMU76420.1 hypothetical protein CISG_01154 [Coccidioides immitis RMSCC 3703]KMU87603.1 hypothetical protein CIHG_05995 [Coccidioides immitis H538.4]
MKIEDLKCKQERIPLFKEGYAGAKGKTRCPDVWRFLSSSVIWRENARRQDLGGGLSQHKIPRSYFPLWQNDKMDTFKATNESAVLKGDRNGKGGSGVPQKILQLNIQVGAG